ncbi:hypothetical protein CC2G_012304 [Coprinopsis cinerea AmutBmut pab1-1]|nr:hypothetical protein CC2G_012304 [Coprinopsis cinerea AmutBmut pab1-1]
MSGPRLSEDGLEKLIEAARGGSIPLMQPAVALLKSQYTPALLDAILHHLTPESAQVTADRYRTDHPDYKPDFALRLTCLQGVNMAITVYEEREDVRDEIRVRLQERIAGIASWILVVQFRNPKHLRFQSMVPNGQLKEQFVYYVYMMKNLSDLHPSLREAMVSTPVFLDLLLYFWHAQTAEGDPFVLFTDRKPREECLVVHLFKTFLQLEKEVKPSVTILDRALDGGFCDAWSLVEGAALRAKLCSLNITTLNSNYPENRLVNRCLYLTSLIDICNIFLEHPQFHPITFFEARCFDAFVELNYNIVAHMSPIVSEYWLLELSGECLEQQSSILTMAVSSDYAPIWHVQNIIKGGLLHALFHILRKIDSSKVDHAINNVLRILTAYAIYPKVARQLQVHFNGSIPHQMRCGLAIQKLCGRTWTGFKTCVDFFTKIIQSTRWVRDELSICDNLNHHENFEPRDRFKSKTCAGCTSVAYCSSLCQKEDWKLFHRYECKTARAGYLDLKEFRKQYRHRYRASHLALMIAVYQKNWHWVESETRNIIDGPTARHNVITAVRFTTFNPQLEVYLQRLPDPLPEGSDRRFEAIVRRHAGDRSSRLVEGMFLLGREQVWVLAAIKPVGVLRNGLPRFTVINSYVRYFPLDS